MLKSKITLSLLYILFIGYLSCNNANHKSNVEKVGDDPTDTAVNVSTSAHTDFSLLPGIGAGMIKIDQDTEEVMKILGRPDSSNAAMQKMLAFWHTDVDGKSYPISIYAGRDTEEMSTSRVLQIRVTSPTFQTQKGVGVASTLDDIKEAYDVQEITSSDTQNNNEPTIWDNNEGIAFEINQQKKCIAVIIHKKGELLSATNRPLR